MRTDKLDIIKSYGKLRTSLTGNGAIISIMNSHGDYVHSIFIVEDKDKNIDELYKKLQHKMLLVCCYVEASRATR